MSEERLDIVETVSGNEYTTLYIDYHAALREIERLSTELANAVNIAREALKEIAEMNRGVMP